MRYAGRTDIGASQYLLDQDVKWVGRYHNLSKGNVSHGSCYLDGLGSGGAGDQACRMVLYDTTSTLFATSDEVIVAKGQAPGWQTFRFSSFKGGLVLPVGDFFAGVHAGGYTDTIQLYGDGPHGMGGKHNTDAYAGGAASAFGSATAVTSDLSLFVGLFTAFLDMLPSETELYFARLPFPEAQAVFALGGPERGSTRFVPVGWHDTFLDPEEGSVALVREGSGLEELLGERIRVSSQGTANPREVFAYVHDLAPTDLAWDISLSRKLFGHLTLLPTEVLNATVDVIV